VTIRPWISLARPKLLPFVLGLPLLGFGFAHWDRAMPLTGADGLLWLLAGWTALHIGTLWLNASVDRDEGAVLFGSRAEPPDQLGFGAWGMLVLAPILSLGAAPEVAAICAVCSLLAVGYSAPFTLWKGHPIGGPVVNGLGYGLLSPAAGWLLVGQPMTPRAGVVGLLLCAAVLGVYFAAQGFQEDEDAARAYRTLVVTHGPQRTLDLAGALLSAAFLGAMGLALLGWLPRSILLSSVLAVWAISWFRQWRSTAGGGTEADARELVRRIALVGLGCFCLAFVEYAHESLNGEAVAGMGTPSGHPPDLIYRSLSER
jgi:4-hydroxybenzoate polyprenyltransferase